ncbi:MAG: pitrilysin family protein [Verrucomicrobiota bacterium]
MSESISSTPPGVTLHTLNNGLTIIVREDHSAPVVSAQAWCKTGSIDEGKWLGAGLSHVLEHMLFKGTTTRGAGRIDQEVQDAGGYMNAYTSFDRTVYWINAPNTGARVTVDVLCDIMQNATLPDDELAKELDVIRREMDMNQDDPNRRASRRLFETAFTRSPYRFTIIGYPDIFNELQPADIRAYYRDRYTPQNMFFVVVGDVKEEEVIAQITEAFSKNKLRVLPPSVLPPEPKQTAPRELIEEASIELGHLHFSWHVPGVRHPDLPALEILATLLGNGRSSRLFQQVREKKALVNSIDAWTYTPGETGLFGMSAMVNADKFTPATAAMLEEIERLKTELVSTEELSKVTKQFVAGHLASRKTMQGQAQDLGGNWMAANDLSFSERYLAAVKKVTRADLQRIAREYLSEENRNLYALLPSGTAPKHFQILEKMAKSAIRKFDFPNGLRLLVKEDHRLPFVEFRAALRGGVLAENSANNGLTQLATKMLLQGTRKRTAEEIASEIESVGGSIDTFGGNNSFGEAAEVMSSDLDLGLRLVADVLLNPIFPEDAFQREQQIQLAGIKEQNDHTLQSGGRLMRRALFGETTYGLDAIGTEESVLRLTVADLQKFHREFVAPQNCVLAIFGDVNADEIKTAVEKTFEEWKGEFTTPVQSEFSKLALNQIRRVEETRDKKQAVLLVGFPGLTIFDKDRYALELIHEACSDLGSRLFVRIRENLGLAYFVGAQHFVGLAPGYFAFYVGTMPEKLALVEKELFKEAELLRSEGLTEEELKRAKAKVIGQKKIGRQDLGSYATVAALDELYGLGYDYSETDDDRYDAVTVEQIKAAAQKYIKPDALVVAIIKPPADV